MDYEYRRSPFLTLHWEGQRAVMLAPDQIHSASGGAAVISLLSSLGDWVAGEELVRHRGVPEATLARLAEIGLVEQRPYVTDGRADAQYDSYWDPFEVAVHRRSASGGYRKDEVISRGAPPPDAFKATPSGRSFSLPAPAGVKGHLEDVLARRRSRRTYGDRPLTLSEVSTLLYHSAQVHGTVVDKHLGEQVFRPFPTAGARSALELYLLVNRVTDMGQGLYRFDPRGHELVKLEEAAEAGAALNREFHAATDHSLNRDPPLALIIGAVFRRTMWKYRGIGLQLVYKDVGCLYQTLYLVTTAMNLAPCAIGTGRVNANADWLGTDPLVESRVGAFLVGPRPDESRSEGA